MLKIDINQAKKYDLKHQCSNQFNVILVMCILLLKELLVLQNQTEEKLLT